jgi:hypothetical protein
MPEAPHNGFEDRALHRQNLASIAILARRWFETPVGNNGETQM